MKKSEMLLESRLDSAFEPTPAGFSQRLEQAVHSLDARRPLRPARWLALIAACLILAGGGALAARTFGVMDFLTSSSMPVDRAAVEPDVKKPLDQRFTGKQVIVTARDYVWHDMTLSLTLHIASSRPEAFRLISQGDFGVDGIHTDEIWWGGEHTTLDKWLPQGKQALVVSADQMTLGGRELASSLCWLPEEQGETFLLEADLFTFTPERYAALLQADGTMAVTVPVTTWAYGSGVKEEALLALRVEAPSTEEWRKLYDGE